MIFINWIHIFLCFYNTPHMSSAQLKTLETMAGEIEEQINACGNDLRNIGTLNIKTQSFLNMLSKANDGSEEFKILITKAGEIRNKVKILSNLRKQEKEKMEQEMMESKIKYKKITEVHDNTRNELDSDFFDSQSSRLDDFIMSSMDSLASLKRQGNYINRITNTLRNSFVRLGGSSDLLQKIESQVEGYKKSFLILVGFLFIVFFCLRFIF